MFSGIAIKKGAPVTAVDWSEGLIKLVQVRPDKMGLSLTAIEAVSPKTASDRDLAEALKGLISKHKLSRRAAIINMPRHLVTKRLLRLPSHVPGELRDMVELQAVKQVPYSRDEIIVDFRVVRLNPDGFADVFLVLAQRKHVDACLGVAKAAGLNVERIALSSEGLMSWYAASVPADETASALIDIDRYHTNIQVMKGRDMVFSRSVSFDALSGDNNAQLIEDMRLTFDAYAKESKDAIVKTYICGLTGPAEELRERMEPLFSLPCEYLPVSRDLKLNTEGVDIDRPFSKASFCSLLGFALFPGALAVNLLPAEVIRENAQQDMKRSLITSAVLVVSVLLTAGGIVEKRMIYKRSIMRRLTAAMEDMDPESRRLSRRLSDIRVIENQLMLRGSSIDILRELYSIVPENISLVVFEYEAGDRTVLRGTAKELSSVFGLLTKLEKSPYFENVKVGYATKRKVRKREVADFEIICPLTPQSPAAEER